MVKQVGLVINGVYRLTERTSEELEMIYEELLHIKALSHLSTMVKRELAGVLEFEAHWNAGKVCKHCIMRLFHSLIRQQTLNMIVVQ